MTTKLSLAKPVRHSASFGKVVAYTWETCVGGIFGGAATGLGIGVGFLFKTPLGNSLMVGQPGVAFWTVVGLTLVGGLAGGVSAC